MIKNLASACRYRANKILKNQVVIGIVAISLIYVLGFARSVQTMGTKPSNFKAQTSVDLERPNFQGAYGIVWEIDDDKNPALDFSIMSYSAKVQIREQKFQQGPPPDAKKFLFLVHRDYDPQKEGIMVSIRSEINKKPFRVEIFGDAITGSPERGGIKYEGIIKLRAVIIWDSINDFAKLCDGIMLGRRYVLEGVLGGVISR